MQYISQHPPFYGSEFMDRPKWTPKSHCWEPPLSSMTGHMSLVCRRTGKISLARGESGRGLPARLDGNPKVTCGWSIIDADKKKMHEQGTQKNMTDLVPGESRPGPGFRIRLFYRARKAIKTMARPPHVFGGLFPMCIFFCTEMCVKIIDRILITNEYCLSRYVFGIFASDHFDFLISSFRLDGHPEGTQIGSF